MHTTERVGQPKAIGRACAAQINPEIEVTALRERVDDARLAANWWRGADVVLDCSDNFATRHAVNRACVAARVPLVSGAVIRFDGQVSVFDPRAASSPAIPACSRRTSSSRTSPAAPWACSRRWWAWSAPCRRPKRSSC
jgi:molybdopterin/thiamine biosynthesis adenylyltransferase